MSYSNLTKLAATLEELRQADRARVPKTTEEGLIHGLSAKGKKLHRQAKAKKRKFQKSVAEGVASNLPLLEDAEKYQGLEPEDFLNQRTLNMTTAASLPQEKLRTVLGPDYEPLPNDTLLEFMGLGTNQAIRKQPTERGRKEAEEFGQALKRQMNVYHETIDRVLDNPNPYPVLLGGEDLSVAVGSAAGFPVPQTGAGKEAVNRLIRLHEAEEASTGRRLARLGEGATGGTFASHLDLNPMLQDVNIANTMKPSPSLSSKGVQEVKDFVGAMRKSELSDALKELEERGSQVSAPNTARYKKHLQDLMEGQRINRHARKFLNKIRGQFT